MAIATTLVVTTTTKVMVMVVNLIGHPPKTQPSANIANTRSQSSNASANWHSVSEANSHVTPDLEVMDSSEAYYGDDVLHVGNAILVHWENLQNLQNIVKKTLELGARGME
ncbi:hypothetical protein Tco_0581711 [Tanacetum coccineum]